MERNRLPQSAAQRLDTFKNDALELKMIPNCAGERGESTAKL